MLLRDRDEPAHFRSFGPWDSDEQVAAWRQSEGFLARIGRIRELLDRFEATPWMWSLTWAARCREAWIDSQCSRSLTLPSNSRRPASPWSPARTGSRPDQPTARPLMMSALRLWPSVRD